ncbi:MULTISPECIES: ketopantoate reductase family protein [unclassified Methylobacterium]|jgi:2-dehydropantoate 2-reductase|uniref:ketopantoate reductase family protein n=1 Tax=unclassified Methylobacterium TaxID=2615210 RepID=UPI0006F48A8B|nr:MULTISPECIES: 2-dehydropantoate 2-reductase [unclassified Methylobacterium]KQO48973.1 2-dehydropantoate 2-reductase [Methylobacterium sp. Leaf86]KQO87928.1 2-dehydropantoate 2-reductase [Methylobacterium sp. Leaf91]MBO1022078.1 2-dehydropantoate 2-reductase [Methylobacterium sp. SD274]
MSIAIVGAGAIGGFLGVRLANIGEDVTFIARGANLDAIRSNGMRLIEENGSEIHVKNLKATKSMEEAGVHDVVLLTVKAHQVGPIAADLHHLIGPDTIVVTMQNGIPWWYFSGGHGGELAGTHLETADPGRLIAEYLDPKHVIGSVVYPAAVLTEPGVVQVIEGHRFGLGELDGSMSPRVQALAQLLIKAGFRAPVTSDIRAEIWLKLWGNLSFNPISALSHATLVDICQFPETRALAADMMREAETIANKLGITFKLGIERRIAGAEKVGAHKTSMLQDVEAGRPIELEALVGSIIELGRLTDTPTPHIGTVYALMRLLSQSLERAQGRLSIATA